MREQRWAGTAPVKSHGPVPFRDPSCLYHRLAQVALVVAGDEGVSGGSGGRLSGQSGQRSRKVYTPPARIFRRLARPDVVSSVAQVCLASHMEAAFEQISTPRSTF